MSSTKSFELTRLLKTIAATLHAQELDSNIVAQITEFFKAEHGSILLFDPYEGDEAKTLIRDGSSNANKLDHFLHEILAGWMIANRKPLLTNDLTALVDKDMVNKKYSGVTSVLSTPIRVKSNLLGILNLIRLGNKPEFTQSESDLLATLADILGYLIYTTNLNQKIFAENLRLKNELHGKYRFDEMIGHSEAMQKIYEVLRQIIPTDARVLLEGESGTGKELIARLIHYNGPRKDKPFVAVDCGAMPATLLEAELFGYVKGAFTGAQQSKQGLFEIANKGTIFLDEITNMPLEIQSKFLRVIEEGEFRAVGSTAVKAIDVRIIAAGTNDLLNLVKSGRFREDLYFRFNVVNIKLPPLRARHGDVVHLAPFFLHKLAQKYNKNLKGFEAKTLAKLEAYSWPGNVRELENAIERMVVLATEEMDLLSPKLLPSEILEGSKVTAIDIKGSVEQFERKLLLDSLEKNNWNQSAAARDLGKSEHYVRGKMKKFGIRKLD